MTRGHLSSDRPAADLAPPPTGPAPGAERPWLQHEGCDQRIAELEAEVERLSEMADLLDLLHDEGFPDDPNLSAALRFEMERLGYGGPTP